MGRLRATNRGDIIPICGFQYVAGGTTPARLGTRFEDASARARVC
jgi:hypothetical protein